MSDSNSNSFFGLFGCLKKTTLNKDENGRTIKDQPLKNLNSRNAGGSKSGGKVQPTADPDEVLCSNCKKPIDDKNFVTEDFDSKKPADFSIA